MMTRKGISVIIPCKNEERYIGKTLESIYSQKDIQNIEVIVLVAPSTTDKTASIAKRYGAKVIEEGRLATARNKGAKKASNDLFLFLDADTYPQRKDFLSKAVEQFYSRKLDVAGSLLIPRYRGKGIKKMLYKIIYSIENYILKRRESSSKPKMQSAMFVTKRTFKDMKGFKEGVWGEDSEFAERAVKRDHSFGILREPGYVKNSVRRFENEGFFKMLLKVLYLNIKADIFGYGSLKGVYDNFYELR